MEQSAGHVEGTIFAAHGAARNRLVRAAVVAGAALVITWVIALALGVMGGFGSLPLLPDNHSRTSSEATSPVQHPQAVAPVRSQARVNPVQRHAAPRSPATNGHRNVSSAPAPRVHPLHPVQTTKIPPTTAHGGHSSGTTRTTGKPAGSPGNGPGGRHL